MNKPSDFFDYMDNTIDAYNHLIDIQNHNLQKRIKWLEDNYNNVKKLRIYFLDLYNTGNVEKNYWYADYLNSCNIVQLQEMVNMHANLLYSQFCINQERKINNSPLKPISEILKIMGR